MGNKLRKFLPGQSSQEDSVTGKEGTYTEKREEELQGTGTSQTAEQNEKVPDKMTEQSVSSVNKDSLEHTESQQPDKGEDKIKPSGKVEGEGKGENKDKAKASEDVQVSRGWGGGGGGGEQRGVSDISSVPRC
jgi:hypothetical protein